MLRRRTATYIGPPHPTAPAFELWPELRPAGGRRRELEGGRQQRPPASSCRSPSCRRCWQLVALVSSPPGAGTLERGPQAEGR